MPEMLIKEADAVVLWNDVPTGSAGWDVLVTTADGATRRDGFDNSTGAIDSEWTLRPEATAKAVFNAYFRTPDVTSLTLEMWADVRHHWLTEFAKIEECGWARKELADDADIEGDNPAHASAVRVFDELVVEAEAFRRRVIEAVAGLPDEYANHVSLLAFSRQHAGAGPALDLPLEVLGQDTDRRMAEDGL